MMRFLYTGDWHLRGSSPRNRIDDFKAAAKAKLKEIFKLAEEHQVSAILCPGDIWDRPEVATATVLEFCALLKESPVPIWATPGNHDLYSYAIETYHRTSLKLLELLVPQLHVLIDFPITVYDKSNNSLIQVSFTPYSRRIDIDGYGYSPPENPEVSITNIDNQPGFINVENQPVIKIHVAHGMLMETEPPFDKFSLLETVPTTADLVLTGHCHTGYGVYTRQDGKIFCNPGAVTRITAGMTEIERPIQVALIDVKAKDDITIQLIPLLSAKPGNEVLDRSTLEAEQARAYAMSEFAALIKTHTGEKMLIDIDTIVETIASSEGLGKDVIDKALVEIAAHRLREG